MEVNLCSPKTARTISVPFESPTPLGDIQNYLELNPPNLPADNSCDLLCLMKDQAVTTFTRPYAEDRAEIRKGIVLDARRQWQEFTEQKQEFTQQKQEFTQQKQEFTQQKQEFERRFQNIEQQLAQVRQSQRAHLSGQLKEHLMVLRFETYSRLLQVLNDKLTYKLGNQEKLDLKKKDMEYITSLLEGLYPHGKKPSPRDQLLQLAKKANSPIILPDFPEPTKRMLLSSRALSKMEPNHLCLAIQVYAVLNELKEGTDLLKDARNVKQHPRPSTKTASYNIQSLEMPLDKGSAIALIIAEASKVDGLFSRKEDTKTEEIRRQLEMYSLPEDGASNIV